MNRSRQLIASAFAAVAVFAACACAAAQSQAVYGQFKVEDDGKLRVMVVGAHPDDDDFRCGGIACKYVAAGAHVCFVSLCNGDKGHQTMGCRDLAARRYRETQEAALRFGIERYIVVGVPDCEAVADLETRRRVAACIRDFAPDIVFTHRPNDYHADHRAAGQVVMDITYLYGVPHWLPEFPLKGRVRPVVYAMSDPFTFPREIRADVIVPVDDVMDRVCWAQCAHVSQVFEWLPWDHRRDLAEIPPMSDAEACKRYVLKYNNSRKVRDAKRFAAQVAESFGADAAAKIKCVEIFELSEYGRVPEPGEMKRLFPFRCSVNTQVR